MPTSESSEMESTNMVTPTVTAFPKIVRNSKIIFVFFFLIGVRHHDKSLRKVLIKVSRLMNKGAKITGC